MAVQELLDVVDLGRWIEQDRGFGQLGVLEPGFKFLECHGVKIGKRE